MQAAALLTTSTDPKSPPRDPIWVGDSDAVVRLAADLAARVPPGAPIGLDTEFHGERRYQPELMLLQLALPDGTCWLVDPLSADLAPLAPVLATREWVAHGSSSDVAVLHTLLGVAPPALWDTQLLGALLDLGYPRRLEDLVAAALPTSAPPGATLTDWSQRPLTPTQQVYAAADAHLVLALVDALAPQLDDAKKTWWRQSGDELIAKAVASPDPDRAWKRLGIAPQFDVPTRQVLQRVARWREARAASRDCPPGYVVPDAVMLDLARRRPSTVAGLVENRRVSNGLLRHHGQALIKLIASADSEQVPPSLTRPQARLARLLEAWALAFEAKTGIAASLLLPGPLAQMVVMQGPGAITGWRAAAVGNHLADFIAGKSALGVSDRSPCVLNGG